MVTGDNILTASHIAEECGIKTKDGIAMEGPAFRILSNEQLDPMLSGCARRGVSPRDALLLFVFVFSSAEPPRPPAAANWK